RLLVGCGREETGQNQGRDAGGGGVTSQRCTGAGTKLAGPQKKKQEPIRASRQPGPRVQAQMGEGAMPRRGGSCFAAADFLAHELEVKVQIRITRAPFFGLTIR